MGDGPTGSIWVVLIQEMPLGGLALSSVSLETERHISQNTWEANWHLLSKTTSCFVRLHIRAVLGCH